MIGFLSGTSNAGEIMDELAAFEQDSGIQSWPQIDGCAYTETFVGKTVGIILNVQGEKIARSRWEGTCHVAIRHELKGWPKGLPLGWYVVAVTSEPDAEWDVNHNRVLNVISVLGVEPNQKNLISAAMEKICDHEMPIDRDCE